MRKISSRWTWWHKKAFPVVWFGFLGIFTVAWIPGVVRQRVPAPTLLIPLAMMVFGYVLMRLLIFGLVDEVWLDDDHLIVRNREDEDRFPITNIVNVELLIHDEPRAHHAHATNALSIRERDRLFAPNPLVAVRPTPSGDRTDSPSPSARCLSAG
jgi:hypothetical protein